MKYLIAILFIAILSGCNLSGSGPVREIGKKATQCCASMTLSKVCCATACSVKEETPAIAETFFFDGPAEMLTW